MGRFLTTDRMTGKPNDPGSWNKYAYVEGDSVNFVDRAGRFLCDPLDPDCSPGCDPLDPTCDPGGGEPGPPPPNPGPRWTWVIDVGYTPVVNFRSLGGSSYDHLFIWIHPAGDSNPADGLVFDGGSATGCNIRLQCGGDTAWSSTLGHYHELTNPQAVDFFSISLGMNDNNVDAGYVLGELIQDTALLQASVASHPYNPAFGPNSNSVVYSELLDLGISVPISFANLPDLGSVGVLNYPVDGQEQLFTGWGKNLLP